MAEITVRLPENQVPFFMALLERLQFVEVEKINGEIKSREQFLKEFEVSLQETKLYLQGSARLPTIEQVLDEL